ncbi:MAG: ATP-binding protein [Rhodobacteraceae bacterium]|nr:ATP-binding protein [Paracoccaceae bacterium]
MDIKKVNFKANAAVKDIVGQGLIYDDNIAIIELVKNAKDAGSRSVEIKFHNEIQCGEDSSIVVKDSGKGMAYEEIVNKWLNIAYSEKKDAMLNGDRPYAGNKGIGRFSCDRLGSNLILYTRSAHGDFLKLPINWEDFENKEQNDEISTIDLECQILDEKTFLDEIDVKDFPYGTVLNIQNLRSSWSDRKLKKLIAELEKFSPSLDQDFEVYFYSSTKRKDKDLEEKLNKKINNNILEKLAFRTTYIKSSIDNNGEEINTTLFYQGDELYTYEAKNPYKHLKNLSIEVHYLDTLAKIYFSKNIGINPNDYGSIFLFYNGFRISPYGNAKNDWLGLDQRKSQGTARNLGTREVFGRIDINDSDNTFSVITSREGLAHNEAYFDLIAFDQDEKTTLMNGKEDYGYVTTIIRQLENFVVSGLEWNRLIDRLSPESKKVVQPSDIDKDPNRYQLKRISSDKVKEACARVLKSNLEINDFKLNDNLILEIQKKAETKYHQYVEDFVEKTKSKSLHELSSSEKGAIKLIVTKEKAKTQAAKEERDYAEQQRDIAEKKVQIEKQRANFFESLVSAETALDALITHTIKQITGGIEIDVKSILSAYYKYPDKVTKEDLVEVLVDIIFDISTIKESTKIATKANFDMKVSDIKNDLYAFLEDYIREVASKEKKWGVQLHYSNPKNLQSVRRFKPVEICVLLVNLIDNSRKANANNMWIIISNNKIVIEDDGEGFDFQYYAKEDYFKKGVTTTIGGSGLGLYHCKEIAKGINADIVLDNRLNESGAMITLVPKE